VDSGIGSKCGSAGVVLLESRICGGEGSVVVRIGRGGYTIVLVGRLGILGSECGSGHTIVSVRSEILGSECGSVVDVRCLETSMDTQLSVMKERTVLWGWITVGDKVM
jgi:hypothetical protein